MLLGEITILDCGVFLLFLVPSLLIQAGLVQTLSLVRIFPFLLVQLPYQLVRERYLLNPEQQSPFQRSSSLFQDVVIRVVRYAFAKIPASIGRVFFSKSVALPFFRFRLLRNGYLHSPMRYKDVSTRDMEGVWIIQDESQEPDVVIYYCHGGGFSMGSSYFYAEFLMGWIGRLVARGFKNPAVFALEYTLVPDKTWPVQFEETRAGYQYLCNLVGDPSRICLSGDSAGATLMLSLLLSLEGKGQLPDCGKPGLALLISPWSHLVSEYNQNTASDFLDQESLHLYARQYVGDVTGNPTARNTAGGPDDRDVSTNHRIISPGHNTKWKSTAPLHGYCIVYGAEEVFATAVRRMIRSMEADGTKVDVYREEAGIHAWPVVNLFLGSTLAERVKGLDIMSDFIASKMR